MSKEPIDLAHSVERHAHHGAADHDHGPPEDEERPDRRIDNKFDSESLSNIELFLAVLFGGGMLIGFISLIVYMIFR